MSITDRNIEAIGKILQSTQRGELKWKASAKSEALPNVDPESHIISVFTTNMAGKRLRITEYKTKIFVDWYDQDLHEVGKVMLEVGNEEGVWWAFPESPITEDLLRAIEYQLAGADAFINAILNSK